MKRFQLGKWWCSTNPKSRGGLWWQEIIDTQDKISYFYNRSKRTYRVWEAGDEIRRDGSADKGLPVPQLPLSAFKIETVGDGMFTIDVVKPASFASIQDYLMYN